jgi:hypothetical protein
MIMDDEILGEDDELEGADLPLEDDEEDEDLLGEEEESEDDAI